ncbi:hypothetical protein RP20_CCG009614 [Aedes albopictus]|nr:hypothetical protein RP20_CCG009614 [Aedes albopictus]
MSNEVFPIHDFPEEVLEHILSFLPLSDRKSASLVCKNWERLAFCRRFLHQVALKIGSRKTLLHRFERRYRNMFVIFDRRIQNQLFLKHLLEFLELCATDVESFRCRGHLTTKQLCTVLSRLPKLQQLTIESNWNQGPRYLVQVRFPAPESLNNEVQIENLDVPHLTQLSISLTNLENGWDAVAFLRKLAPQLEKVDLYSTGDSIPLEQLQFPKVEVLKIGGSLCVTDNDSELRTFFAGFRLLKEVRLETVVKEIAINMIIKACPGIELFEFKVSPSDPIPFHLLERLKHLKTLGLGQVYEVSENSLKCNPLESVKNLSLELSECGESSIDRLRHLLPNVIAIDVATLKDDWTFERGLRHICRNFRGLQRLEISDRSTRSETISSSLLVLEQLDQLEELIFKDIHTRIVDIPPNPLLKLFVMNHPEQLSNGDLLELAKQYTNLRYLELGPNRQVTPEAIAAFKSQLVNCAVHCVLSNRK